MAPHPGWTRRLLSEEDFNRIGRAIREAEAGTSGEIRVHLERRVPRGVSDEDAVLRRAHEVLCRLEMHTAKLRNAVLIYLAVEDRRLAIVGDEGIHRKVGDAYWRHLRDAMVRRLKAGNAGEAITDAVDAIGRTLGEHFPRYPDEPEDPSDPVSTG